MTITNLLKKFKMLSPFPTSFTNLDFSLLQNINHCSLLKTSKQAECITLLLTTTVDGKLTLLMISFQFMKKVENQFGEWILNNHGNLFFSNSGQKETMFLLEITIMTNPQKEDISVLKIQLHLSSSTVSQTATGNSLT